MERSKISCVGHLMPVSGAVRKKLRLHPEARPAAFSAAGGAARFAVLRALLWASFGNCAKSACSRCIRLPLHRHIPERMFSFYVPPADQLQLLERLSDEVVCVRTLFDMPFAFPNRRKSRPPEPLHLRVSHEGTANKTL